MREWIWQWFRDLLSYITNRGGIPIFWNSACSGVISYISASPMSELVSSNGDWLITQPCQTLWPHWYDSCVSCLTLLSPCRVVVSHGQNSIQNIVVMWSLSEAGEGVWPGFGPNETQPWHRQAEWNWRFDDGDLFNLQAAWFFVFLPPDNYIKCVVCNVTRPAGAWRTRACSPPYRALISSKDNWHPFSASVNWALPTRYRQKIQTFIMQCRVRIIPWNWK